LLELGRVFLLWLKSDSDKSGSPVDTLFEVLDHMKTMSDVDVTQAASTVLKVNVLDINSPSWRCPSEALPIPGFANTVHVQKNEKHLGVFFTQSSECEFMNRWPMRARISVHLDTAGRRTSKAAKDFTCEFTKQWRNHEQGQGFPDFVSLLELKPEGKYVHDGCINMQVNMSFEPHPVFRLCTLFASCGFQQIRGHPKLSMLDGALLKNVLTCDRLDAKTEPEVLEVVASHVNHYPSRAASMLECVRFAFVPVSALAEAFRSSNALRKSDHFKKRVLASLRSTEDGIVCGRRSYVEDDVQLTIEALVDLLLCGNQLSVCSNDAGAEDNVVVDAEDFLCACQCATHNRTRCETTAPCKTELEVDEEEEETLEV